MLVYSVTDRKSFEQIRDLYNQVSLAKEISDLSLVPVVLVANKIDLKNHRKVTTEEGQQFADELHIPFIEVSAKTRHKVDEAFEQLVQEVRRTRTEKERRKAAASGTITPVGSPAGKGGKGGEHKKKGDCNLQ